MLASFGLKRSIAIEPVRDTLFVPGLEERSDCRGGEFKEPCATMVDRSCKRSCGTDLLSNCRTSNISAARSGYSDSTSDNGAG